MDKADLRIFRARTVGRHVNVDLINRGTAAATKVSVMPANWVTKGGRDGGVTIQPEARHRFTILRPPPTYDATFEGNRAKVTWEDAGGESGILDITDLVT